jgi:hypothetical protein
MTHGKVVCKKGQRTVTVIEKDPPKDPARKKSGVKRRQPKAREGELARPAHILTPTESAAWWKESLCRDPVVDFVVTDEESGIPFIKSILIRLTANDAMHPALLPALLELHSKFVADTDYEMADDDTADADTAGQDKDAMDVLGSGDDDEGDDDDVRNTHALLQNRGFTLGSWCVLVAE